MDALDIFPGAGIRFVSVQHEQNAVHMADGFSRVTNRPGVCIAQNGPGITNFVTGVAAAYWAHSPVVVIAPETGSLTNGLGGFQETNQVSNLPNATSLWAKKVLKVTWYSILFKVVVVVAFYMHELKVFANFGTYFAQSDTDDTMYLVLVTD